ncbi:N-acetylglucosamine-6-phosphate deacetylase [Actinoallomurus iriomotensis]|uniref:N-acetylglucosamine-6-phosphate deacetylase n=1 Tax=Actinoallomurus iriomotensis TaxID=478107 RepID=A0A9W6VQ32_9ACTN|nr:amidohydrolase family protein [Actinoallomurus iriomotensis]GLY75052.1 N-acetylglucosamine-6-phosphate deacetylase [Actinoallomurus iriomotensis]
MRLTGRDPATGRTLRVSVEDGRIAEVRATDGPAELWLAPGLVDLQVNGFAGHDVNAADVDETVVTELVHAVWRAGVTTVVPTIVTAPEEDIRAALSAVARARAADPLVAHAIPYAHVEGPFISAEDGPRGVHDPRYIRRADLEEVRRWGDLVGMLTVSPHDDAAIDLIAGAVRLGVRCAIGHTHADPAQITRAVDAGAELATHLGNGAHAMLPRHPNHLWTQLADDRLYAGFIADGHHLPADAFRAMLRAKGIERSHLVSDTTALGGMSPGRYRTAVGGEVELSEDGRLSYVGTPYLAGASRSLADGVATAISMADLTLSTALRLASANPGRFTGGRGVLRPGTPADLITFAWRPGDTTLDVRTVVVAGTPVVSR